MAAYKQSDYFPIFLLGALSGLVLCIGALVSFNITHEMIASITMSYADLITIMLTAVTVIITVLAVFIAILAVWGYSQFRKMTEVASENHLNKILADGPYATKIENTVIQHVSDQMQSGELRKLLVERIDHIIITDASLRADSANSSNDDENFKD